MEEKVQTAVEWLAEQMLWNEFHNPYLEKAKEMEKDQIRTAFVVGKWDSKNLDINSMQYYNKTFEKDA